MAEGSVGLDGPPVATGKGVRERRFWADLVDVVVLPAVLARGDGPLTMAGVGNG